MWILSYYDAYMSKCNCCVLLSESIHVFMHLLCWIYSHPLKAGWAPAPLWCRFFRKKKFSSSESLRMAWSLLVYLSLLGVFIESMLWFATLGIGNLFYFRLVFLKFFWIQFRCGIKNVNCSLIFWKLFRCVV